MRKKERRCKTVRSQQSFCSPSFCRIITCIDIEMKHLLKVVKEYFNEYSFNILDTHSTAVGNDFSGGLSCSRSPFEQQAKREQAYVAC